MPTHTTGTATITVKVKDQFGNLVKTAAATDFVPTASAGTLGAFTCNLGVCTATYTAPVATGPVTINVKIGTSDILFSPLTITIN